jgi:hypothetical protein
VSTLVDYLKKHPGGGPVPASSDAVDVPQRLLTKDNVEDPDNAGYIYKASCQE